jgi:two-component system sensor histidine kinase TctE
MTQYQPPSPLTRSLVFWLLVPLLTLLLVSAYIAYRFLTNLSQTERDAVLEQVADNVQDFVSATLQHKGVIEPSAENLKLVLQDARDVRYYAIYDAAGRLLAGDSRLVRLQGSHQVSRAVFNNLELDGRPFRRVVLEGDHDKLPGYQIQVAETMLRRNALASRLSWGVLGPDMLIFLLSFPLIWFGVKKGLRPIEILRQRIVGRSAHELESISTENTPRELLPLAASLNGLLSRVRMAQDEQRRFIADAAHQIKTPLAALTAEIELALGDAGCQCAQPTYQRLHKASSRLAHLVQQLLTLAHSEAYEGEDKRLFDLSELARDVTGDYVSLAAQRNIDMGFEGELLPVVLKGNAVLVREAIRNLVENALKYTPDGGVITVSVKQSPPVFSVADSGPGIAAADQQIIFKRFNRGLTNESTEGSGLGLSIVKEVARSHGASVTVSQSSLGGALFELHFHPDPASKT